MSTQIQQHRLTDAERLQMLQFQTLKHEISPDITVKLRNTERLYNRLFIVDNSGSMEDPEVDLQPGMSLFDVIARKWEIVYGMVGELLTLSGCIDRNGVRVCFLNPVTGLEHMDPRIGTQYDPVTGGATIHCACKEIDTTYIPDNDIDPFFNANGGTPIGHTPLTEVFNGAVEREFHEFDDASKRLYVTIITDGIPTARDGSDNHESKKFKDCLTALSKKYKKRLFVQIISVTKEERVLDFLKSLDGIDGVDTTPDFTTMKQLVQHARGKGFVFTKGIYYAKCLLGPIDPSLDDIDKWHLFKK